MRNHLGVRVRNPFSGGVCNHLGVEVCNHLGLGVCNHLGVGVCNHLGLGVCNRIGVGMCTGLFFRYSNIETLVTMLGLYIDLLENNSSKYTF